MLHKSLIILVLLLPPVCYAVIYRYTDHQGNIVYSNKYRPDAEKVDLPKLGQLPKSKEKITKLLNNNLKANKKTLAEHNYTRFNILRPADQETFYNQRKIELTIDINPELQSGDKIVLYIDDNKKPYFSGNKTRIILYNLPRGEHKLQARLIDAKKNILMNSAAIIIYVKYTSIKIKPPKQLTPFKPITPKN